jgi:hypothetical protein
MSNKDHPYHCPRCQSSKIIEYDDFIECTKCLLEFDKKLIGKAPDDEILSRQEMGGFLGEFEELKDPKKTKEFFDSLMRDLNDEN